MLLAVTAFDELKQMDSGVYGTLELACRASDTTLEIIIACSDARAVFSVSIFHVPKFWKLSNFKKTLEHSKTLEHRAKLWNIQKLWNITSKTLEVPKHGLRHVDVVLAPCQSPTTNVGKCDLLPQPVVADYLGTPRSFQSFSKTLEVFFQKYQNLAPRVLQIRSPNETLIN